MKKYKLATGKEVEIAQGTFSESVELYELVLGKIKNIKMEASQEIDVNFYKDIFCATLANKDVRELALSIAKRSTYEGEKIVQSVFEAESAREDYLEIMTLVICENIMPFMKGLYGKLSSLAPQIIGSLK